MQKLIRSNLRPCTGDGRAYPASVSSWGLPSYSQRQEPLTYIRGWPIDLTTLLVIINVVAALAAALAFSGGYREACYDWFVFDTQTFWAGRIWTPFTDPFFHDLAVEKIWFVVGMFFFWRFGRDLELYLGRASYALLFAALVLIPVVAVLISAKLIGAPNYVRLSGGTVPAYYAMFIGFCIVYPGVMFFCIIPAMWAAIISIVLSIAVVVATPDLPALVPLLACLATVYAYLQYCGANRIFDPFAFVENWKQDRALKKFEERQKLFIEEEEDFNDAVNPILDKIAKEGIQSLTPQEKQKLERARAQLLKREKPRRN